MIASTCLAVFFVPSFYVVVRRRGVAARPQGSEDL
jgi:hypothetical protein